MCQINSPYKDSLTFTGYKVIIKVGKRVYSPFTGIEYKKGLIPFVEVENDYQIPKKWAILSTGIYRRNDYSHKTSVIRSYEEAHCLLVKLKNSYQVRESKVKWELFKIVKMTISGNLHRSNGAWNGLDYYAITGENIVKVENI